MKKRLTAFLVLCMLFCMHGTVFAVQSAPVAAQPDLMRDGSITVHLNTVNETPGFDSAMRSHTARQAERSTASFFMNLRRAGTL